jgi:ribonuclease III
MKDKTRLAEALRHSSYVNEKRNRSLQNNERLEFLGDAVLNLAAGHILMERFAGESEGSLSRMRASLVNEARLAAVAKRIQLGAHLRLSKGEHRTGGRNKRSILADAVEAVIAAVYLDAGFETALALVKTHVVGDINEEAALLQDCKSRLQEILQTENISTPAYEVVRETGPDHDKTFVVRLVSDALQTEGIGKSKKAAEQDAARRALQGLSEACGLPADSLDGNKP